MENATTLPTDVPTLHLMLREQQQLIESLKANLHRLLKWRFGPKGEALDVDQFGLFADGSLVIEVPAPERDSDSRKSVSTAPHAERRRAVRVLKHLPRVIEQIDVQEEQKTCPCCGERTRCAPTARTPCRDEVLGRTGALRCLEQSIRRFFG